MRDGRLTARGAALRGVALAALLASAVALAAGWTSSDRAQPRIWVAGPFVKLQATTRPAGWQPLLVAPRGGRASFQLVVDGGAMARPTATPLLGAGGARIAGAVTVLRQLTVPVNDPSSAVADGLMGEVPDPLVPVSVRPQAGPRQAFWVSVQVPRGQAAGSYRGSLRIAGRSVAYRLRVADVTLPARRALHTWFLNWQQHADDAEGRPGAWRQHTQLLRRWGIGDGTLAGGDAAVGVRPHSLAGEKSDAQLRRLARTTAVATAQLKRIAPAAIPYSYVYDEPTESQADAVRRWGTALRAEAPGVRQLVTAPTDEAFGRTVGAWSMHLGALTPEVLATTHELGAEAWIYSSCCETPGSPTLLLDQHAVGNLAVAPASWLQGAKGLLYWSVNDYTGNPYRDARNHGEQGDHISNGDGVLLYPGRRLGLPAPTPSLRIALTAAGLQIVDEAALLARRGRGDEARAQLRRVLPETAKFVDNPASWQAVERELLRLLEETT